MIPEHNWEQKREDIIKHKVSVFAIGDDWRGHFDSLNELCEVEYLPRTDGISTTAIRTVLSQISPKTIEDLQAALTILNGVVRSIA